jgi:hypothetical protein
MSEVNDVTFIYQEWHCEDGCCDEYWYDCLINGEQLDGRYGEPSDAIEDLLSYFGVNGHVDFVYGDERYN